MATRKPLKKTKRPPVPGPKWPRDFTPPSAPPTPAKQPRFTDTLITKAPEVEP